VSLGRNGLASVDQHRRGRARVLPLEDLGTAFSRTHPAARQNVPDRGRVVGPSWRLC
jgi:hypothetical protein